MMIRSAFTRVAFVSAVVAGLVAMNALWNAIPVKALGEVDGRAGFGLITLVPGQQARLNVVRMNTIEPDGSDRSVREVTLAFDVYATQAATEGNPLLTTAGRSTVVSHRFVERQSVEVTLRVGEATSFEFTATEHTLISAVVVEDPNIPTIDDRNIKARRRIDDLNLRATLEVREAGRSSFVLSPAAVLFGEVDGRR